MKRKLCVENCSPWPSIYRPLTSPNPNWNYKIQTLIGFTNTNKNKIQIKIIFQIEIGCQKPIFLIKLLQF